METSSDKQWASKYLLDPLTAPEPSQETGPGTQFNSTFASHPNRQSASSTSSSRKPPPANIRETSSNNRNGRPTPPASASPSKIRFPTFGASETSSINSQHNRRISSDQASTQVPTSTGGQTSSVTGPNNTPQNATRVRRTSSLSARYQGDRSHRPLEMIARDQKLAHRSHHLRKQQHIGADSIDQLDVAGGGYHHGGPFDAASLARNREYKNSPIEAVAGTNAEALKATAKEKIVDAVRKHRPLDGVAATPPGEADREGRVYNYDEGTDLMREDVGDGGAYKRWPGVKYHPDDLKGKGEPSYSIEKALKDHNRSTAQQHRRVMSEGQPAYEMMPTTNTTNLRYPTTTGSPPTTTTATGTDARREMPRPGMQARSSSYGNAAGGREVRYSEWQGERERESAGAKGLRKRIGSLRG